MKVRFRNPYKNQIDEEIFIAPEGVYTGQFIYAGKKAQLAVGNVMPVGEMPEGTVCCNAERYPGDRGKLAKVGGEYVTIIGHNEDTGITKVRLPSGAKKNLISTCRAVVSSCWRRSRLARTASLPAGGGAHSCPPLLASRHPSRCRSAWSPAVAALRSPS